MTPDQQALIPFRPPVVLPHVEGKWEGLLRDYAWAMPSKLHFLQIAPARAWQSLGTAMSSHSAADAVPSLSRRAE
jgi:hypothetical protein